MTITLADYGGAINFVFRVPEGNVELEACHKLCRRVFQNPSSPAIPLPAESNKRLVLAAFAGDKIVGTGRIECPSVSDFCWWQISSVATDKRYQGRYRIASTIMRRLEVYAGGYGCHRITLSAATQRAEQFYVKRGYTRKYPHGKSRLMYKDL